SVVCDLNEFLPACFDLNLDAGGTGVEGVFEELLDDRSRAFHDLAGGDFVGYGFGEDVDLGHFGSRWSFVVGRWLTAARPRQRLSTRHRGQRSVSQMGTGKVKPGQVS